MTAHQPRHFKYYDLIMAAFATVLLCSNLIGAGKICQVFGFTFGAGILFFPISYVFGDILTEVYGFARARKVVWAGFGAILFAALMSAFIVRMPPAPEWGGQEIYERVFGQAPRIILASLVAFWMGEFTNSYVLAKLKILTEGRFLWVRTIGSTVVGEGVDSLVFYPLAFYGLWSTPLLIQVLLTNYTLKVLWEVLLTPVTYKVVSALKKAENVDHYDRSTNFTPFSLETDALKKS